MTKPTIHFAFTVPRSAYLPRRVFDRALNLFQVTPLYRFGYDAFIPWQWPLRSTHAIAYHLLHTFRMRGYPVRFYTTYEHTVCPLKPNDIFIGMPLPANGFDEPRSGSDDITSVTSRTIREYPQNKNFIIMPYAHDATYVNWSKDIIRQNALQGGGAIFIGGDIWQRNWERSPLADILFPKKIHVIMGIDPLHHPRVKKHFNAKGKRKYLYMGHTAWYKNTRELERIASELPQFEWAHIGGGTIPGWKKLAEFIALTPSAMTELARDYDFFVSTSSADPQATTILEQMCAGLVVACTPETGYEYPSLVRLSVSETESNVNTLLGLQYVTESDLLALAECNREIASHKHSWQQFCDSVASFMEL